MTDYNRAVGNAGTMTIRDDGATVSFIIACGDGATNVGSYSWSGVVNGVPVGGSVSLPAGFGSRVLGSWGVSTAQRVTFHQNATGTSGLGGAADHAADIPRAPVNVLPSQPPLPVFQAATPSTLTFGIGNPDTWGSGTPQTFEHQVAIDDFVTILQQWMYPSTPVVVGGLAAAQPYRYRYRAVSSVGAGAWSYGLQATTTTGVRVSDGGAYTTQVVDVSDGAAWVRQRVDISDGTAWKPGTWPWVTSAP
jgi:hypothetical protein